MARKTGEVSIYSIAKELGISPSAVSRVVNNRTGVSEETRRNVHVLLRKYNFKVNYPPQRKTRIAIVSANTLISLYISSVISGIRCYVQENDLMICSIMYDHSSRESLLSVIRDQQCSGVIILNPGHFDRDFAELDSSGLPVMLVDMTTSYPNIGFVDNDSYLGVYSAVRHLISLGHRKIGYLNGSRNLNHLQRCKGYLNAMKDAGIDVLPAWNSPYECGVDRNEIQNGFSMCGRLLDSAPELTAVMATNDNFALGALHAAVERGLRVPEDLSIVGFDDYEFSAFCNPSLTTVLHPSQEAGRLAALSIDRFLKSSGKEPLLREILPTKLMIRNSTAAPRKDSL